MDPFFGNNRWYQQPEPTRYPPFRGVPVYEVVDRTPEKKSPPKVVRIPVHFVGSERVDRSGSAVKIQKVFRGFLVRKCMRKIKDVKMQVDEIGERLLRSEVVELVRRDEKERLRMNESLMSLLFKLDSICGVDFGVRACRKAVIRKVIALQERIDSISTVDVDGNGESVDEIKVPVETQSSNQSNGMSKPEDSISTVDFDGNGEPVNEIKVSVETQSSNQSSGMSKPEDPVENSGNLEGCIEHNESCVREEGDKIMDVDDVIDVGVDSEVKVNCVKNGVDENPESIEEGLIEEDEKDKICDYLVENRKEKDDDNKRNGELLERMKEDNEKMMNLMTQLFERNETQMRMLNALTHRVELLEKAFVCDKLRKKKKKKPAPAATCTQD